MVDRAPSAGQVVDTETAREFMQETLARISDAEVQAVAQELERKHEGFARRLSDGRSAHVEVADIHAMLRSIFATRRRIAAFEAAPSLDWWRGAIPELLEGSRPLPQRFQAFVDALPETLDVRVRRDLTSELLHFSDPDRYWLWTRWIWEPEARTGALPLVVTSDFVLDAPDMGDAYVRVGEAVVFVQQTAEAAGLQRGVRGIFGTDVYLACVYGVYLYTVLRLRMTQEFNKVIPALPELIRRLLGTYRLEI
jgi:hypothetical protein